MSFNNKKRTMLIKVVTAVTLLSFLSCNSLPNHPQLASTYPQFPSLCSAADTDGVSEAALACEVEDYSDASDCVVDYMKFNYQQDWNLLIKISSDPMSYVAFWSVTGCIVKLQNFGRKYNRTYIAWADSTYPNQSQKQTQNSHHLSQTSKQFTQQLSNLSHQKPNPPFPFDKWLASIHPTRLGDKCQSWVLNTVVKMIEFCDLGGDDRVAECVKDRIKNEIDEYWNVYVKSMDVGGSSVSFGTPHCFVQLDGYGKQRRHILLWQKLNY